LKAGFLKSTFQLTTQTTPQDTIANNIFRMLRKHVEKNLLLILSNQLFSGF